jgi:transketolase
MNTAYSGNMAFLAEVSPESPDPSLHVPYETGRDLTRRMADALRVLALDALTAARSGEIDVPLGMADAVSVLWSRFLKFDAGDPHWPDRDRFVLSSGQGTLLLYALLHLTGHADMRAENLQQFCNLHSPTAGHPQFGAHPAIEATSGPAGQGLAQAVGMALAERLLAARFGRSLIDHRVWVLACGSELMEGITHEAISLAGHFRLEKLTVLVDAQALEPVLGDEANPIGAGCEDVVRRFNAQGWAAQRVDAQDADAIAAALSFAVRSKKPTVILLRSMLGIGLRGMVASEIRETLGWRAPQFITPEPLRSAWLAVGAAGAAARRAWLKRIVRHPQRAELERVVAGRLPEMLHETITHIKSVIALERPRISTERAGLKVLETLASSLPEFIASAAGSEGVQPQPSGMAAVAPGSFAGRFLRFGLREHALAAALNGLALHGGLIPTGACQMAFSDYLRPSLRLACLMRQRVIYIMTHDGLGVGEDGPTHQAVEQLATLRAMPGLHVFRPADAMETAEAWDLALRRNDGPSVLVLGRQTAPSLRSDLMDNRTARGGYVLAEAEGARAATLIASGSEVDAAMAARALLGAEGRSVAVVSLPCWELFGQADAAYRARVLGGAPRFGIEAACGFGWERWLGTDGFFIGISGFGASAPCKDLYEHYGLTPEAIAAAVRKRIG